MKIVHALTALLCLLIVSSSASAGIRPSFFLEASSWRATDIVVVAEEEQIDGVMKVLETLKGDLKPGQVISIPELAEFKTKEARLIHTPWERGGSSAYVTGARMILFLRDANTTPADADEDESPGGETKSPSSRWKTAGLMGHEIKYSTVWIEKGKTYCFSQVINPGPSLLVSCGLTEAELKTKSAHVLSVQNGLDAALAVADPKTRAESLEPFAQEEIYLASERAFAGLIDCGEAALPVLRRMLNNESLRRFHSNIVQAFAKAGGKTAGPELTAWIEKELAFWKRTTPALQPGWWNGNGFETLAEVQPLRDRSSALYYAIYALDLIRYAEAEPVLIELTDYWRAVPQLDEGHISEACDQVLRQLRRHTKNVKRPRAPKYEISFSGNKAFSSSALTAKVAEYVSAYDELENDYGDRIGEDVFEYALRRLREFITSQGYLNASFESQTWLAANGKLIAVRIEEGRQFRLGQINIKGATVFSPERLRSMLDLQPGDVANGAAIDNWLNVEIEKLYSGLGYFQSYTDREPLVRKSKEAGGEVVDFTITIEEGAQYRIGAIKFEGKSSIDKDELHHAMLLREGDVFSRKQMDESIAALNKLGLNLERDDIGIFSNNKDKSVKIVIVLNKDRRPDGAFDRFSIERNWYR